MNLKRDSKLKLGFPEERHPDHSDENLIYTCRPASCAVIYVWERDAGDYGVNIYHYPHIDPRSPTNMRGRFHVAQAPINCTDPLELQLAINYLIQTHLPAEVTENEAA